MSALGVLAVVAATGGVLAALALPSVRALFASPLATVLGVALVAVMYVSGIGLLAAGALLHHVIRARRLSALTYEGLVEETSQEFDKVSARLEHLEAAVGNLERRSARRAPDAKGTPSPASRGPEPVPVNVLPRVSRTESAEHGDL